MTIICIFTVVYHTCVSYRGTALCRGGVCEMQSRCTRWGNVTQKLMEVPFVPEVGGRRASFLRVTWNPASLTVNTTKLNLVFFPTVHSLSMYALLTGEFELPRMCQPYLGM